MYQESKKLSMQFARASGCGMTSLELGYGDDLRISPRKGYVEQSCDKEIDVFVVN